MVDIVQSSANQLLIRKIGYSVGLESTLSRFEQLVDYYGTHHQITEVGWRDLVCNVYKRDTESGKHFANLFRVLDLLETENGRPVPLTLLDAGALLRQLFINSPVKYRSALIGILLYALTLADGELFGALLLTQFQKGEEIKALEAFRTLKLRIMYDGYKAPSQRRRLHQLIDFHEIDSKGIKEARNVRAVGPFAPVNTTAKQDTTDFTVSLSADWYKKVPPRRASWARDLGLMTDNKLSGAGERYLTRLRRLLDNEYRTSDMQSIVIMPTDMEFRSHHVTWPLGDSRVVDHIDLASAVAETYADDQEACQLPSAHEEIDFLRWALDQYARADMRFHMLRRDLPYTVFLAVEVGRAVAEHQKLLSPRDRIEGLARSCPELLLRSSRNSLYGISFSKR